MRIGKLGDRKTGATSSQLRCGQPAFAIFFDGVAPHPVRALLTQNGFQPLFAWVQQTFMEWPVWYFHEFDEAKEALYEPSGG